MTLTVKKVEIKQRGNQPADDKCFHHKFCTKIKVEFINNLEFGHKFPDILIEKLALSDKRNNAESDVRR